MTMAQHFLLSRQAKTLSLGKVFRMPDAEVETLFRKVRWPETDGAPVCSHCGSLDAYDCRRPNGAPRFRCRECKKDFSITSGTLFASHKLPLRGYLAAIAIFCNEVKGKSMLAMSRDLGVSYKSSFVLAHKLREAMSEDMRGRVIGDDQIGLRLVVSPVVAPELPGRLAHGRGVDVAVGNPLADDVSLNSVWNKRVHLVTPNRFSQCCAGALDQMGANARDGKSLGPLRQRAHQVQRPGANLG